MSRLKILMLTCQFPSTAVPGAGTFCVERARALAAHADVRVMVPVPYYPGALPGPSRWRRWQGVPTVPQVTEGLRVTYPRYLAVPRVAPWLHGPAMHHAVVRDLEAHYGRWRPDVVDGHFAYPDGYAAWRLARHVDAPVAITCHGSDLRVHARRPFTRELVRATLRHAARVMTVNAALQEAAIALGAPREHTLLTPNGVDPDKFALRCRIAAREALGLPADRTIAVQVGQLITRKDQALALETLAELVRRGAEPPLLVLVGDGPNRAALEREVHALSLGAHVRFAGERPHAEVAQWMSAGDWLLLTSRAEGWPTVYYEAMACGRPVISSDVTAAREAIPNSALGIVVPSRTAVAFADALQLAMRTTYDASHIRRHAVPHTWARWASEMMEVFRAMREEHARSLRPVSDTLAAQRGG